MAVKSERLVILLSKEEKARIAELAKHEELSMGELARGALLSFRASKSTSSTTDGHARYARSAAANEEGTAAPSERIELTTEQTKAIERLADHAVQTLGRANAALDKAFEEIEATKDYFERNGARYQLVPGVQVMCSIRTGQRSVLAYLVDPFLGSMQTAMRER